MSWIAVARKDFRDAIRSRMFWALAIVFGLLSIGIGGAYGYFTDELAASVPASEAGIGLVFFVQSPITIFIMFISAIICHKSIVGEWEQGSLKLLLSLPHTRSDVILGKIVGRAGVIAVPAIGSLVLGLGLGAALLGGSVLTSVDFLAVAAGFLVAILVYIALYVSIFVGVSAITRSSSLAVAGSVALIVLQFFWSVIIALVTLLLDLSGDPDWLYIPQTIMPNAAFNELLNASLSAMTEWPLSANAGDIDAVYASPWTAAVILLLWIVVPVAIGYWRFKNADL
ncbi:ABC transporter permease subunit [Halapricum desulfuricans]|uniref:ABC-type transport system involved in multi-copper enzyme maturation, permease component n=1 Tax=Halapricum desulfuricans TaxID=2841257 RepID=A0A897NU15_9EURY|nr:ABC transporter permease subunit [Halapricum desulfuricans]QSG15015.1 ABC-type transport system involved in multi-copper enzyme maturation, permease component [Halapricum desulfuricans]